MSTAGMVIYIVDDDASVRQALARLIRSAGMRAETFEAAWELLARASSAAPDCVIADIRMPEISGLELPGLLETVATRIPVIFVTAYDTDDNRAEARRVSAAAFFHKPTDGQALLDAIAWAVESAVASAGGAPSPTPEPMPSPRETTK